MQSFDFEELLTKYRYHILIILLGLILVGSGLLFFKKSLDFSSTKVEILQSSSGSQEGIEITAEISGAVMNPGVYKFSGNPRIDDLLIAAGGFSGDADRIWSDKYLNRAAKLTDGQKVYIPKAGQQSDVLSAKTRGGDQTISSNFPSDSNALININSASLSQLDSLPGIGQVYGQNIIEHRPYSTTEELVSKGAIKQSVYKKIKDRISVY